MNWSHLQTEEQLATLNQESFEHPVLVFKHSTRCIISATALSRFERHYPKLAATAQVTPYLLDLLQFRPISARLAQDYDVEHQSPQVLVISQGKVIHTASHFDISAQQALAAL